MNILRRTLLISMAALGVMASSAFAADANISGTWNMTTETSAGTGSPTFTLKQAGKEVTGDYQGALGQAPVTGTVKENNVALKFTVNAGGMELTVTYTGTVEGNTMKGKVSLGELGEGTFTGRKS
ncbi:hypothetical protein ACFPN2_23360 [Steroidobacter flavus]|uniref:Lipocalin-like domain-containing protein n=1 Tax=Steroidobacter flavus TaxID=1842136 RepID=A0ABV8T081_9GAMM